MGTIDIKPAEAEDLEVNLTLALDIIKAAKGQKPDRVKELCTLVGLTKRNLAAGLVFQSKGKITFVELAHRLSLNESTVRRWPEIHRALKAR